ncbi:PLP-dependent aminotransferase family protein [Geothrix sp. 21YS21S-2]|uniref:aminotransferase-like domain-containing protein n=1 Tax=Geothrix sp. 21YS21S-2 TaxID=3068893 RepID=UPI0027B91EA7|nr:PLP-dependent aminotransferase family protein [Geothrix sp. 21YS21S-2]
MRARKVFLALVGPPDSSVGRRILLTLRQAIVDGTLAPGSPLPGTRAMASAYQANRQTVVTVIEKLEAEGLLESRQGIGTFVAETGKARPEAAPAAAGAALGFDVPSALGLESSIRQDALLLADGAPDATLAPTEELAKAYRRALGRHGAQLLGDHDPLGTPLLRDMTAEWLGMGRSTRVSADRVVLVRGSSRALNLIVTSLLKPGDVIAVENPGNRNAWEILAQGGRHPLVPLRVDSQGVDPEDLERQLAARRIRALYLTPGRQFPTGASLPPHRVERVLELAARYRTIVIEDDYDSAFVYGGIAPRPMLAEDTHGLVIHIGSFSRLLAPGLRLGYVVLPAPLVALIRRLKRFREGQGDPALEWAMGDLIRDGDLTRHLRRATEIYRVRRDTLVEALRERLGHAVSVEPPAGGMGLWIKAREGVDAEAWIRSVRNRELVLNPPSHYFLGDPEPGFRMGFAQVPEADLREGVERLVQALAAMPEPRQG